MKIFLKNIIFWILWLCGFAICVFLTAQFFTRKESYWLWLVVIGFIILVCSLAIKLYGSDPKAELTGDILQAKIPELYPVEQKIQKNILFKTLVRFSLLINVVIICILAVFKTVWVFDFLSFLFFTFGFWFLIGGFRGSLCAPKSEYVTQLFFYWGSRAKSLGLGVFLVTIYWGFLFAGALAPLSPLGMCFLLLISAFFGWLIFIGHITHTRIKLDKVREARMSTRN
jgi:hypothetical protein